MELLDIEGAWVVRPRIFSDDRGDFLEWFRGAAFREAVGHELTVAQANCSVSKRGSLRGIHFADVPPGQGKYVTCVRGAVLDVIVDIRLGSPTYGQSQLVPLNDTERAAVYVSEGLGHGFLALTDDATVMYLCSTAYNPTGEHGINPLDPGLGIAWPADVEPLLSDKDRAAPSLETARTQGLLPSYDECVAFRASLRA